MGLVVPTLVAVGSVGAVGGIGNGISLMDYHAKKFLSSALPYA